MSETRRLRTAIVGVGGIGYLHAQTVSQYEGSELVAVVDASSDRAEEVGRLLGTPSFTSLDDMLAAAPVEAVIVAVPDTAHVTVAGRLLEAGIPVMLEKPIAANVADARRLAGISLQTGSRLFIGHTLRFDARYVAAHDAVQCGDIGTPLHFLAGRETIRSRRDLVKRTSSAPFDLGVHDIDAVQWITGKRIVEVSAFGTAESDGGPSRHVVASCRLEGAAVGQIYCGWTRLDSWPNPIDAMLEVGGTEGVVAVRVHDDGGLIANRERRVFVDAASIRIVRGEIGGHTYHTVRHFFRSLATSQDFAISLEEAISAVSVAEAINRSVESRTPQRVDTDVHVAEAALA